MYDTGHRTRERHQLKLLPALRNLLDTTSKDPK